MAKQQELAQQLNEVNATLQTVGAGVEKIGTETTTLLAKIADLETQIGNLDDVSPELQSAFDAVKEQANVVASKVQTVDALVPDA